MLLLVQTFHTHVTIYKQTNVTEHLLFTSKEVYPSLKKTFY
ncbi:hypothetical protein IMSAGC004_00883 [Bacteroidaceae bacterium]|nr:hypothetical protein IMSAGC004_00883 [Bacteroidaceae bacterium]